MNFQELPVNHSMTMKIVQTEINPLGGGTPYIQMIGMIVIFFRGCTRWQFSIFLGLFK